MEILGMGPLVACYAFDDSDTLRNLKQLVPGAKDPTSTVSAVPDPSAEGAALFGTINTSN
jgi:hypothetical protein